MRRRTTKDQESTTFAIGCCFASVLVIFAACTTPNPNFRPPHSDAAENSKLGKLSISPGSLVPEFDPGATTYLVDVDNTVGSLAVTATPQDSNASLTVNGQDANSGQERRIPLNDSGFSTPILIAVSAADGSQSTYIVTVNRAALKANAKLQALSVSPGSLAPSFSPITTAYLVSVANTVSSVSVAGITQDTNAKITLNGQETSSSQARTIVLNGAGANTQISVVVTAENGAQNTYVVTVNRAPLSPGGIVVQ